MEDFIFKFNEDETIPERVEFPNDEPSPDTECPPIDIE